MMIVLVLCAIVVIFFTAVSSFGNYEATEVQDNERPDTRNVRINLSVNSTYTILQSDLYQNMFIVGNAYQFELNKPYH